MMANKIRKEIGYFKKNYELFLLSLPGILIIFTFCYIPMFGIIVAFKDFNFSKGILGSDWVWFDNFRFLLSSQYLVNITRNTILYNLGFIVIGTSFSIIFALLLNEVSRKSVKIFQTAFLAPYFLSWVIVSYVLYALLDINFGVINNIVTGFGGKPISFYSESAYWPYILSITYLWKSIGYTGIMYYTALIGIDSTYYEAARIDGATKIQQIRHISLPMLKPLVILLTLLAIGRIFYSDFGLFYFIPMNTGVLFKVTNTIDTYVYRALKTTGDIGMASAAGLYQSVIGFILVLTANRIVKKVDPENSIF